MADVTFPAIDGGADETIDVTNPPKQPAIVRRPVVTTSGGKFVASRGFYTSTRPPTFHRRWRRNGLDIDRAVGAIYDPDPVLDEYARITYVERPRTPYGFGPETEIVAQAGFDEVGLFAPVGTYFESANITAVNATSGVMFASFDFPTDNQYRGDVLSLDGGVSVTSGPNTTVDIGSTSIPFSSPLGNGMRCHVLASLSGGTVTAAMWTEDGVEVQSAAFSDGAWLTGGKIKLFDSIGSSTPSWTLYRAAVWHGVSCDPSSVSVRNDFFRGARLVPWSLSDTLLGAPYLDFRGDAAHADGQSGLTVLNAGGHFGSGPTLDNTITGALVLA